MSDPLDQMFEVPGHRLKKLHADEEQLHALFATADDSHVPDNAWPSPEQLWHFLLTTNNEARMHLLDATIATSQMNMDVVRERDQALDKAAALRDALDKACDALESLSKSDLAQQLRRTRDVYRHIPEPTQASHGPAVQPARRRLTASCAEGDHEECPSTYSLQCECHCHDFNLD